MKFELLNPEVCPGTEVDLQQIGDIIIVVNKTGAYKIAEQLVKTMAGELCMSGDFNIEHMSIDIQQEIYNTLKVHIRQKDIVTLVLQGMANKMRN